MAHDIPVACASILIRHESPKSGSTWTYYAPLSLQPQGNSTRQTGNSDLVHLCSSHLASQ